MTRKIGTLALVVAVCAACSAVTAQPLPEIHDVYHGRHESHLGPDVPVEAAERWLSLLAEARAIRYAFRLRIEPPDGDATEAAGRAEITLKDGRPIDFRLALDRPATTLVPRGSTARDGTAVDTERPTKALDHIARGVVALPVLATSDGPPVRVEPTVLHFANPADDEHVYLTFDDGERFPSRITRVTEGPTRTVLDIADVSVEAR